MFPLYVNYYFDIPRVKISNFLGLPISKKSLMYFLGLQILSTSYETGLAAFFGIVSEFILIFSSPSFCLVSYLLQKLILKNPGRLLVFCIGPTSSKSKSGS